MKNFFQKKPLAGSRKGGIDLYARFFSLLGGLSFVLFTFSLLFSDCDVMGGSLSDFIDYNTNTISVKTWRITSASSGKIVSTRKALMHDPNSHDNTDPNTIVFEVTLNNPQQYDFAITPVIYEFIGADGEKVSSPPNRPITVVSSTVNTVKIQIGNTQYPVMQGDSFRIRLNLATKDGSRVFEPYMGIPQIIYDTVLRSPWDLHYDDGSYPVFEADWTMQGPQEHVGINKITVTFTANATGESRKGVYLLQGDGWKNTTPEGGCADTLTKLSDTNFCLPFPFPALGMDKNYIEKSFKWLIDMEDKNGLTVSAGQNGSTETYLNDLQIDYLLRGETAFQNSTWEFDKETLNYHLTVPFVVEKVRFQAEPNTDIFGTQEVRWGGDSGVSSFEEEYPLAVGDNPIIMEVYWKNPDFDTANPSLAEDMSQVYTFTITRLHADRDSTLKNLIVQDVSAANDTDNIYPLVGGFDVPPADVDSPVTVKTYYTVYVPSTVNGIKIKGDYLSSSEIYNEKGRVDGKPDLGDSWVISTIDNDDPNYPAEDYLYCYPLQILRNGWTYSVHSGVNVFYINVKPEDEADDSLIRHYVINVIKTDAAGNANAMLDSLTITARPQGQPQKPLLDTDLITNPFNPDILNYTVYVPYALQDASDAITLSAAANPGSEIREITSVNLDLTVNAGDLLNYPPSAPAVSGLNIPFGSSVVKKRITLTIYSDVDSTPKNYTITLIRCLPALSSPPSLTGNNGSLRVTWLNSAATAYEVFYSDYSANPVQNIPELAMKWMGDFSGSTVSNPVIITGLTNSSRYNVWVRSKDASSGRFGEWTIAQTTPLSGAAYAYGIPGAAELTGLSFALTLSSPTSSTYTLDPPFNPSTTDYTLTVPGVTTGIDTVPVLAQGTITHSDVFTVPNAGVRAAGYKIISTLSPDGATARTYNFSIVHLLTPPALISLVPQSKSIQAIWSSVSGAESYEIYYGSGGDVAQAMRGQDIPAPGGTQVSTLITGLTNGTSYNVWVRAKNSGTGPGDFSSSLHATPADGSSSGITFTFASIPSLSDETFNISQDNNYLYLLDNTSITVTIPSEINLPYQWFIDGQAAVDAAGFVSGSGTKTLTVYARYFTASEHRISARIKIGDYWYSKTVVFEVLPYAGS